MFNHFEPKNEKNEIFNNFLFLKFSVLVIGFIVMFTPVTKSFAQNNAPIVHVKTTDPLVQSLPNLEGTLGGAIEVPLKNDTLLICQTWVESDKSPLKLFTYLKMNSGEYKELLKTEIGDSFKLLHPETDWVKVIKLSRDKTIQFGVQLDQVCCHGGNFPMIFSYDPETEKMFYLGLPRPFLNIKDLNADGNSEILVGEKSSSFGLQYTPMIEIVEYDHFVDVSNQFSDYYRNLIKEDEKILEKELPINIRIASDIQDAIILACDFGGFKSEAEQYVRKFYQKVEQMGVQKSRTMENFRQKLLVKLNNYPK